MYDKLAAGEKESLQGLFRFSDAGVRKRNGEGGKRHAAKVELAISTRHIRPGAPLGLEALRVPNASDLAGIGGTPAIRPITMLRIYKAALKPKQATNTVTRLHILVRTSTFDAS